MIAKREANVRRGEQAVCNGEIVLYSFCPCFCGYVKIYKLSDKSGNIFYVGCTTQIEKRFAHHVKRFFELNGNISISVIEEKYIAAESEYYARKEMFEREVYWINKYNQLGYKLCNIEGLITEVSTTA